jgi:hypothetical protein
MAGEEEPTRDTQSFSGYTDLPTEIKMSILAELMGPAIAATSNPRMHLDQSWPFQIQNRPSLDTATLFTDKATSAVAKSVLNTVNKWVAFDITCAHLLLPWACIVVPFFVINPKVPTALPQIIMNVEVRLFHQYSEYGQAMKRFWPKTLSHRQLFLVHVEQLAPFLQQLRIIEFTNSVRLESGRRIILSGGTPSPSDPIATVGDHGLRISIDTYDNYPTHEMKDLLNLFRIFRGSLNQIRIKGIEDTQHALAIERAITTEMTSPLEPYKRIVQMQKLSSELVIRGHLEFAAETLRQAINLFANCQRWASSPSASSATARPFRTKREVAFAVLGQFMLHISRILTEILSSKEEMPEDTPDPASLVEDSPPQLMIDTTSQFSLPPLMKAWLRLVFGLHCIFCRDNSNKDLKFAIITYGIGLIRTAATMVTPSSLNCLPEALKMCDELQLHGNSSRATLLEVEARWRDLFTQNLKLILWHVHVTHVPKLWLDNGVLEDMGKLSDMAPATRARVLVARIWEPASGEETSEDDWYSL